MDLIDLKNWEWNGLIQTGYGFIQCEEDKTEFNFHNFNFTINATNDEIKNIFTDCEHFESLHIRTKNKLIEVVKRCIAATIYYGTNTPISITAHRYDKNHSLYKLSKTSFSDFKMLIHLEVCEFLDITIGHRKFNTTTRKYINVPTSYMINKDFINVLKELDLLKSDKISANYSYGYLGMPVVVNYKNYVTKEKIQIDYKYLSDRSKRKYSKALDDMRELQKNLDKITMNYTLLFQKNNGQYTEFYKRPGKSSILLNTAFYVRRIFTLNTYKRDNNICDFNLHGRYYHGISNLESVVRKNNLFIKDNKTGNIYKMCELDYPNCFVHLAYSMVGLNLQDLGVQDAYLIPWVASNTKSVVDAKRTRSIVKKVFVILFNTDKKENVWEIIKNVDVEDKKFPEYYNVNEDDINDVVESIISFHSPISKIFLSKAGLELMYKESQIARDIYHHFAGKGVPIICVHDSFLVPENHIDDLEKYMFKKLGVKPTI